MPYTPAQVAKIARVSVQTCRNYSREYRELFSEAARGETGPRIFDDQDLQVFCTIAELRKAGVSHAEVVARIRAENDATAAVLDLTPESATSTPQNTPKTPQNAPQPPQISLTRHDMQLLVKTFATAENQRRQSWLWSHAVAFYLGLLTMGVLFFIVWWIVRFL